nr:ferredoxin--nitrite reductase, chloroplastic-like [Ipomoea batatas]
MASLSVKFLAPSLQIHPANKLPKTTRLHATPPQTVAASPPSEINAARLEPRVEERDGYFVLDLALHVKNGKEKKHDHFHYRCLWFFGIQGIDNKDLVGFVLTLVDLLGSGGGDDSVSSGSLFSIGTTAGISSESGGASRVGREVSSS